MPREPSARLPLFLRLRKLLLVVVLLLIAGLVALYLFGRARLDEQLKLRARGEEEEVAPVVEGVTTRSEGFDYTQYDEGRAAFRIQGEGYGSDAAGVVYLDRATLTLYRENGEPVDIESREASYDPNVNEAVLTGDVRVTAGEGSELETSKLIVTRRGDLVASPAPFTFRYAGRVSGAAERLQVELPSDLYLLQGQVRVESQIEGARGAVLTARRVYLENQRRLLRADGGVELTRGHEWLRCRRLSAYLAEERNVPVFVRAQWEVDGHLLTRLTPPPAEGAGEGGEGAEGSAAPEEPGEQVTPVYYEADNLHLVFSPDGSQARKVELEGTPWRRALLRTYDATSGLFRTLTSNYVLGDLPGGALETLDAFGQVLLVETRGGSPEVLRQARAERATARFLPDGGFEAVSMLGGVEFRQQDLTAFGDRAEMVLGGGGGGGEASRFLGEPARLRSERGQLTAPEITYHEGARRAHATGGVRALLEDPPPAAGTLLDDQQGPIWVESREAFWERDDTSYLFRGDVRAWRGEDLILARELRVHEGEQSVSARGDVRTVWQPRRRDEGGGRRRRGGEEPAAMEVTAETFDYRGRDRHLRYTRPDGVVRVVEGRRVLECREVDSTLTEDNEIARLVCVGRAMLNDGASGRVVRGERAVYDPEAGTVDVRGEPAVLENRDGSEATGRRMLYNMETGSVEIFSREEETGDEGGDG